MFSKDKLVELARQGAPLSRIFREAAADAVNEALLIEARRLIEERQEAMADGRNRPALHGTRPERDLLFAFGPLPVKTPRVRDRSAGPERMEFSSRMLPRRLRRPTTWPS